MEGTHERLKVHRRELVEVKIGEHSGHRKDNRRRDAGGILERRRRGPLRRRGAARDDRSRGGTPEDRRIRLRIGINLGDVIVEDDDKKHLGDPHGPICSVEFLSEQLLIAAATTLLPG